MNFSEVLSRDDLAHLLGIKKSHLTYVLYKKKTDSYYTSFEIPKKSEGTRTIDAPTGFLKNIQKRLAYALWDHQRNLRIERNTQANISHAFEKKKSIMTNAQIHKNKYIILNVDLEHFFESFHFGRVSGFFEKNRDFDLPHDVAIIIAQLTCYKGHLPQGAPTSPIITNLICQILDMRILRIAKKYKLDYTRYADDMTFSTNNRSFIKSKEEFMQELGKELNRSGFTINHKKTRLTLRDSQQMVTGLVVNKKVNIKAEYYRQTRAMAYCLYSQGLFSINGKEGTLDQLEGRFSFINQIDRYNNKRDGKKHAFDTLNGRERQYRAFLFYKYFYAHKKPLIVTEGKTDIRYLKSALKKLWYKYPDLITRDSQGRFKFNITFLQRTERLAYFLGIAPDGANTMKNIYNYFSDGTDKRFPNYYAMFSRLYKPSSLQPVILLFDNEMVTGTKPLSDFVKYIRASETDKKIIQSDLHLQLIPESNLYLMTIPLIDGQGECEIEHLFSLETQAHSHHGKTLCLKDKYDKDRFFGKDIFSKHVYQNYSQIDFDNFTKLLDTLSKIVNRT